MDTAARRPNFLVIGAAKSGTTALYKFLKQHPQVHMSPRKHTRFFAYRAENPSFCGPAHRNENVPYAITDLDAYHALFADAGNKPAIGEASHSYMYRHEAADRIYDYDPSMKLVAVIRNPAERAYSHYRQMLRDEREPIDDFVRALEQEGERIREGWWPDFHYVSMGLYSSQLRRYYELFDREQIKVYLYEELNADPKSTLGDLFRFLGVDEAFVPETRIRYNASGIPRSKSVHKLLRALRRTRPTLERLLPEGQTRLLLRLGSNLHNRNLTRPGLSPRVRREVTDRYFRDDVLELQDVLRRDLSAWLG